MPDAAANESPPPANQQSGPELPVDVEAPKVIRGVPQGLAPESEQPAASFSAESDGADQETITAETERGADAAPALADSGPPSATSQDHGPPAPEPTDHTPPLDRRFVDALDAQRRMAISRLSELVLAIGGKSGELSRLLEHFDTGRLRSLLAGLAVCKQGEGTFSVSPGDKELAELRTLRTWLANLPVADQQLVDGLDRAIRTVPAFQAIADLSGKVDAHAAEVYAADIMERDLGAVRDANHDKAFVAASLDTRTVVDLVRGMLAIRRAFKSPAA